MIIQGRGRKGPMIPPGPGHFGQHPANETKIADSVSRRRGRGVVPSKGAREDHTCNFLEK